MMKNLILIIFALVFTIGCGASRRAWVPRGTTGAVTQSASYRRTIAPRQTMYGQRGYGPQMQTAPYGAPGMVAPPAMFVSEYAGSTYDPRTHGAVVQAEMAREQARRSGATAPPLPGASAPTGTGCTDCATREELGVVMDQVDQQGRAVDALRREVDER